MLQAMLGTLFSVQLAGHCTQLLVYKQIILVTSLVSPASEISVLDWTTVYTLPDLDGQ